MARTLRRALLPAVSAAVAFAAALMPLSDWDTFHHLAYGRELFRHGGFPASDPLLYPLAGASPGASPSWLGSVLIHLSHAAGGIAGPTLLAAMMAAALFALLARDALEDDDAPGSVALAGLTLALALATCRERLAPRPEMFSTFLLAGTMVALRRHAAGRSRLLWAFPVAAVVWMNLHHTLAAGLVVLAIFVGVDGLLLAARRAWPALPVEIPGPRALIPPLVVAIAGAALAALLSPGGAGAAAEIVAAVFERAGGGDAPALVARMVDELRPLSRQQWLGPFGALVALTAAGAALDWRRLNLRELVTCAAFVVLAAGAQRFAVLAAVVLAPIAARGLRAGASRLRRRPWSRWLAGAAACAGVAWAASAAARVAGGSFGTGVSRDMPLRAAAYLESIGFEGRLYNTFHLGGYLEWALGLPVFQDARGALLPEDAAAALAGPGDYRQFAALDGRYRFDALVAHYPQFSDAAFRKRSSWPPGTDWGADRRTWSLVAFDDGGQVYLRRDGAYSRQARDDEYHLATPTNPLVLGQPGDPTLLFGELERSVRESPSCARCRVMLGFHLLELGRPDEAEPLLARGAEEARRLLVPEMRWYALWGLARAAQAQGQLERAVTTWRRLVDVVPDPRWARRQLAQILLDQGRLDEAWAEIERNLGDANAAPDDLELGWRIARARGDEAAAAELRSRLSPRGGGPR